MSTPEGIPIDEIIERAGRLCDRLPPSCSSSAAVFADLSARLSQGLLRLAVLGQFNRGKSTFINTLVGEHLLPVSVIPVTSLPTVLRWGEDIACTVRFFDGSAPRRVVSSREQVRELLESCVTEEANPANCRCVADVTVELPCDLLRGGTVLVDTPGFGSTHVHNTRTTVEYLKGCDAALFLLSADLPITQMELSFLSVVHTEVPRLFFVFNKVDLLGPRDLAISRAFIEKTLTERLDFLNEVTLYPVCARPDLGEECDTGMEAVRERIVTFLAQEKFFALAHAIHDRVAGALQGVETRCCARLAEIDAALEETTARCSGMDEAAAGCRSATTSLEQQIAALGEQALTQLERGSESFATTLAQHLHIVVNDCCAARGRMGDAAPVLALFSRVARDAIGEHAVHCCEPLNHTLHEGYRQVRERCLELGRAVHAVREAPWSRPVSFAPHLHGAPLAPVRASFLQRRLGGIPCAVVRAVLEEWVDEQVAAGARELKAGGSASIGSCIAELRRDAELFVAEAERVCGERVQDARVQEEALRSTLDPERETLQSLLEECTAIRALMPD